MIFGDQWPGFLEKKKSHEQFRSNMISPIILEQNFEYKHAVVKHEVF